MAGMLEGKAAIVTGGGSSIGHAACLLFAREGTAVVVADIDEVAAQRVAGEEDGRAIAWRVDVADRGSTDAMVEAATKHAVIGLTRTAGIEHAAKNIRVNAVLPAGVDTPINGDMPDGWRETVARTPPIKRVGRPEEIADAAGVDPLDLNYRLAPEHPFPAGLDDLVAAYRFILASGIPPERIALAGDSAGGGLAASGLLAIRQQGLPSPACVLLISPWTDLTTSLPAIRSQAALDPICTQESLQQLAGLYARDLRDPLASPLHGDWSGQPPLCIEVGEYEILLDDGCELANKAAAAGVEVTLDVSPMGVHVYPQVSQIHPEGAEAIINAGAFFRKHLGQNRSAT